ncbi:MAG TPA: 2-hydroxyacid dehydrogenase [Anaerohalosphaeraceae bacterium]|nr:2-hydroxyacid dehydrogenase [Phycisphaerae bacterium]HOK94954.1 2-hydroxyacid dehydrogenase [Anaerohalosphaeraceae bacterium]HOL31173.1 2-hydroxyacid dehydrogenase [Anaerohalosphaeraceae bacterium]HOM75950.1 2-hydroxyacid dehydrogenase [Anaerohalosphaeraceae bacterium]HPC63500.1 2-hydroxyacid dehydrogenase [Anaerohalosphaeraceae bacterium]
MQVAVYSTKPYVEDFFKRANQQCGHKLVFLQEPLTIDTVPLAKGSQAVCIFVNDTADAAVLMKLKEAGIKLVALRCAGFNNVDIEAAQRLGLCVVRVPAYSPYAVAEHTVALMLALNRRIHRAHWRVREGNFSLDGLMGFDLHGSSVGIIGTGRIGEVVAQILHGFGCRLYAYDVNRNPACEKLGVQYAELDAIYRTCSIITLHCPLVPQTYHLIDKAAIDKMQDCVMLINTSRGALIDTKAVIDGLKSRRIGYLGLDVYEEEGDLFFQDLSDQIIQDDVFARLLMFPNVIITGHQAFFTHNALQAIAHTTLSNITAYEKGNCQNILTCSRIIKTPASR